MSGMTDILIKKLADTINSSPSQKTSPYDTQAEVRRIEGDTAWVHIPGGVDETPVQLTTNAKKGDIVQVRVSGGRAWLYGNATAPPTDDTTAKEAKHKASVADENATNALTSSMIAKEAADSAQAYAEEAKETTDEINAYAETAGKTVTQILADGETAGAKAQEAWDYADQASVSAGNAQLYANMALTNLGLVEDVVGTLNWIQQHGYYELSQDDHVIANNIYYTVTATAIANPTGNPNQNIYYERSGAGTSADPYIYELSQDTTVDVQKTYYSLSAVSVANPTGNPNENLYYELLLNSALSQYVSSHLSLTNAGLTILNDNSSGSMLMSIDGVTIKNANGVVVGQYGEGATIGALDSQHISIVNGQINFWAGTELDQTNLVAYVSGQELHIPRVVVVQSLQMGDWRWDATMENHLSLNWIGE